MIRAILIFMALVLLGCATTRGPLIDFDSEWPDDEPYCADQKYAAHPDCK